MKIFVIIFATLLLSSCLKDENTVDVGLYIKTPFNKGEFSIQQNESGWIRNNISFDSICGVFAYGVEEGAHWKVTIFKDSAYYQRAPAILRLVYNRDTSVSYIYFDSLTTSVSKEFYISK